MKKTAARVAYGAKAPSVPTSRWPEELLGRGKEIRRFLEIDKDPNDVTETRDSEIGLRGLRGRSARHNLLCSPHALQLRSAN